jgi:hypothetical protein
MRGQNSAEVFELQEARPAQRIGYLVAMVKGGIVVAIGRVEATEPYRYGIRELIAELRPLQIHRELASVADFKVQFDQSLGVLAKLRCQIEIDRSDCGAMQVRMERIARSRPDISESMNVESRAVLAARIASRDLSNRTFDRLQPLVWVASGRCCWRCDRRDRRRAGLSGIYAGLEFANSRRELVNEFEAAVEPALELRELL